MALNVKTPMTETLRKIRNNDKIFHVTPDKSLLQTAEKTNLRHSMQHELGFVWMTEWGGDSGEPQ